MNEEEKEKKRAYKREYYKNNKDKIRAQNKFTIKRDASTRKKALDRYHKNKDPLIEERKLYAENNKEHILEVRARNKKEYMKKYREDNKEEIAACRKVYRIKNADKIKVYDDATSGRRKEYSKEYRKANKIHEKVYKEKYNKENKEHINYMRRKRRKDNPEKYRERDLKENYKRRYGEFSEVKQLANKIKKLTKEQEDLA